jgi:hypothetical protein
MNVRSPWKSVGPQATGKEKPAEALMGLRPVVG